MINDRIRYPQVRVVDDKNNQLGVMDTRAAMDLARDRDLDLILVAAAAQPPVCRIMDYGKYKYEKSKRDKSNKNTANELKTVRLHPRTGEHDRSIVTRHTERFLREGHKVRVVCQFKGRENAYPELGKAQLDGVAKSLADIAIVEGQALKQGREMAMMLSPKPGLKPLPKVDKFGKEIVSPEDAEFLRLQAELAKEAGIPVEVALAELTDDGEEGNSLGAALGAALEAKDGADDVMDIADDEVPTEEVRSDADDVRDAHAETPAQALEAGENDVEPEVQPT